MNNLKVNDWLTNYNPVDLVESDVTNIEKALAAKSKE
jgi:hypothetical protein